MMEGNNRIIKEDDLIDDWDPMLLEYPFTRKGMTAKEFDEELKYLCRQSPSDLKNGNYKPLWQQKEEGENK